MLTMRKKLAPLVGAIAISLVCLAYLLYVILGGPPVSDGVALTLMALACIVFLVAGNVKHPDRIRDDGVIPIYPVKPWPGRAAEVFSIILFLAVIGFLAWAIFHPEQDWSGFFSGIYS